MFYLSLHRSSLTFTLTLPMTSLAHRTMCNAMILGILSPFFGKVGPHSNWLNTLQSNFAQACFATFQEMANNGSALIPSRSQNAIPMQSLEMCNAEEMKRPLPEDPPGLELEMTDIGRGIAGYNDKLQCVWKCKLSCQNASSIFLCISNISKILQVKGYLQTCL